MSVSPSDAASYAGDLLAYCLVLFFVAAIPYVTGFVIAAGARSSAGGALIFGVLQMLTYAIVVAGLGGLLYKIVADAVAAGNDGADATVSES